MGCEGEEQKYGWEDVIPPWQQSVAEKQGGLIESQLGQPATGYPGPLMTGMDPLMTAGAGALMGMQGQGYSPPPYMGYEEQGYGTPGIPGWNYNQFAGGAMQMPEGWYPPGAYPTPPGEEPPPWDDEMPPKYMPPDEGDPWNWEDIIIDRSGPYYRNGGR